jgi:hypothetical protein
MNIFDPGEPHFFVEPTSRAMETYAGRNYYLEKAWAAMDLATQSGAVNYIDLWNLVPNYGKVTRQGVLMVPREGKFKFMFGSSTLGGAPWFADALEDLKNYLGKGAAHGRTRLPTFFNGFDPVISYVSPYAPYYKYATHLLLLFNKKIGKRSRNIVATFDRYVDEFIHFMENRVEPFTFASYFGSNRCGTYSTGLCAAFARHNANGDHHKAQYLVNPELTKYLQSTANFGLRVDINAPWRVVADLESEPMQKYLLRYNIGTIQQMFNRYYIRAVDFERVAMMSLLTTLYKEYQTTRQYGVRRSYCVKPLMDFNTATFMAIR